jgi:tRNA G18 (ribose-2'-O)-methylase SpoU
MAFLKVGVTGADAVFAPKDNTVGLAAVICRGASGAAESVPYVQVTNLALAVDALKQPAFGSSGPRARPQRHSSMRSGAVRWFSGAERKHGI